MLWRGEGRGTEFCSIDDEAMRYLFASIGAYATSENQTSRALLSLNTKSHRKGPNKCLYVPNQRRTPTTPPDQKNAGVDTYLTQVEASSPRSNYTSSSVVDGRIRLYRHLLLVLLATPYQPSVDIPL